MPKPGQEELVPRALHDSTSCAPCNVSRTHGQQAPYCAGASDRRERTIAEMKPKWRLPSDRTGRTAEVAHKPQIRSKVFPQNIAAVIQGN